MGEREQILSDYLKYSDPSGLISGKRNPWKVDGNAILFTAEMVAVLRQRGHLDAELLNDIIHHVKAECQIEPGLYRRGKGWKDQEGPDDYIGLVTIREDLALDVLEYGMNHYFMKGPLSLPFYYRNEEPRDVTHDLHAWLGRQPSTIAHFHYAAGVEPSFLGRVAWAVAVGFSGKIDKTAHDTWILSWFLIDAYTRSKAPKNWMCDLAIGKYWKSFRARWPGGFKQLFSEYFVDAGHPTAVWWP